MVKVYGNRLKGFDVLVREMRSAKIVLDGLPADYEFTHEQLDTLDDIRHTALRLADVAEDTIKTFEGTK